MRSAVGSGSSVLAHMTALRTTKRSGRGAKSKDVELLIYELA
jgi:hypothetical protein